MPRLLILLPARASVGQPANATRERWATAGRVAQNSGIKGSERGALDPYGSLT